MRFCSARNIASSAIDEEVIDSFLDYRRCTTSLAADAAARRSLARHWNDLVRRVPGWPSQLVRAAVAQGGSLSALGGLPDWLSGKSHPGPEDAQGQTGAAGQGDHHPGPPRRARSGAQDGDPNRRRHGGADLAFVLSRSRRQPAERFEELDDMRADLEHHRPEGMTDKNLTAIRTFMQGEAWWALHHLPQVLMGEAKEVSYSSPIKAAVRAQMAVAIAILNVAPIRLGNLGTICMEKNLIRTGGPQTPYRLVFPNYDVKNRVKLDFPLHAELTAFIDDYLFNYRPALVDRADDLWLFPGAGESHKLLTTLSDQITSFIEKSIGLRLTVHQFRHLSAAIILKHQPGNYELVRLLLGHRTVQVTIRNYIGLESTHASEVYGELVRNLRMHRLGQGDDDA
jgi:hypothetical protein